MFRINLSRSLINIARSILTGKIAASEKKAAKLFKHVDELEVQEDIAVNQINLHYDALHVKAASKIESNHAERKEAAQLLSRIS
jgi:hypothetical protein